MYFLNDFKNNAKLQIEASLKFEQVIQTISEEENTNSETTE